MTLIAITDGRHRQTRILHRAERASEKDSENGDCDGCLILTIEG